MRIARSDLEEIALQSGIILSHFHRARIFMIDGTVYLGKWMIELFCYLRERVYLDSELAFLSRNALDSLGK